MVAVKSQANFKSMGYTSKILRAKIKHTLKETGLCGRSVENLWCSPLGNPCWTGHALWCEPMASSQLSGLCPLRARVHWGSPLAHSLWCPKPDGASKCSYFSASINLNQKKPEDRIVTSLVRPSSVSQGSQVVSPLFWLHAAHYDGGASASGSRVMGLHHVPITRSP